jgi:hypothetical protein
MGIRAGLGGRDPDRPGYALTEIDIENLIRAKGAIFSGCMTLLTEVGMGMQDIDRIILAGGFGSYVDLEKAMTIGLLPEIDAEKVTFIGNSSLLGSQNEQPDQPDPQGCGGGDPQHDQFRVVRNALLYGQLRGRPVFAPHGHEPVPATKRTNGTAAPRNPARG